MDKKIDCEIVRDLLPSYVDGLTSGATNIAVEEHLADCADCAEALRRMRAPEPVKNQPAAEVDYLKKVRRRTKSVVLICGIVMMLVGMLLLSIRYFYVGNKADAEDINYNVSVDDNTIYFSGNLVSSTSGISRIVFTENDGVVNVTLYIAPKAFLNNNSFSEQYEALGEVNTVRCDGLIIWEDGTKIGHTAAQLYASKNPYIGDMPANSRIATILGVSDQLGPYTNELQTSQEPYGWTLILETRIAADEESAARDIMTADSYVMLATVGNLGYVTWRYETESGRQEYTIAADDASAFAGQDIKRCANSPSDLQKLMQRLSIKWSGVRETYQENEKFLLNIHNSSHAKIYGLAVNYYLNGELLGTRTLGNANNTALTVDSDIAFDFVPKDFPKGTSAIDLSGFSFDLSVVGSAEAQPPFAKI